MESTWYEVIGVLIIALIIAGLILMFDKGDI